MRLARKLRRALDHCARSSGMLAWMEARMRRGLTVLMYHRVLPAERCARYPFPTLAMPEPLFERQMEWLSKRCEVLPLFAALQRLSGSERAAKPLVAVTFDDGYADNHELAAPVLERHGLAASFFVTTDFVASQTHLWFDRAALLLGASSAEEARACAREAGLGGGGDALPDPRSDRSTWLEALKRAPPAVRGAFLEALERARGGPPALDGYEPLSRAQVADLHRRGHEIGSHSLTHPILVQLEPPQLERELRDSRALLEGWTGTPVRGFCYPNGDCDQRSVAAVRAAGYAYACTTQPGIHLAAGDPLRIARVDVTPQRVTDAGGRFDLTSFRAELCAWHELWR